MSTACPACSVDSTVGFTPAAASRGATSLAYIFGPLEGVAAVNKKTQKILLGINSCTFVHIKLSNICYILAMNK